MKGYYYIVAKSYGKDEWRVVTYEWGSRSLYKTYKDFDSAYKMAKALGAGAEPKIED